MVASLYLAIVAAGHAAIWIGLLNRVHALPIPRWVIHFAEKWIAVGVLGLPAVVLWIERTEKIPLRELVFGGANRWLTGYFMFCAAIWIVVVVLWLRRYPFAASPAQLVSNDTTNVRVDKLLSEPLLVGAKGRLLGWIPGNQMLDLHVHRKSLQLDRLPPELDGLTIAHLSDLHFAGTVRREFFDVVVEQTNLLRPDIVVITGDIVDFRSCVEWIPATLGKLRASQAKYFILGNHDLRFRDAPLIRRAMMDCGFLDVAARWLIHSTPTGKLLIAGNERPCMGDSITSSPSSFEMVKSTPLQMRNASTRLERLNSCPRLCNSLFN